MHDPLQNISPWLVDILVDLSLENRILFHLAQQSHEMEKGGIDGHTAVLHSAALAGCLANSCRLFVKECDQESASRSRSVHSGASQPYTIKE